MEESQPLDWPAQAGDEFNHHENRHEGTQVAFALVGGLRVIRDSLYLRVHRDVEQVIGRDSMLAPVSELKAQSRAIMEIDAYEIAESAIAVRRNGYAADVAWYQAWLAKLLTRDPSVAEEVSARSTEYLSQTVDGRRLAFMNVLAGAMPESIRAPLVLFRLLPLAVHIATACAFRDHSTAGNLRRQQQSLLPGIVDCRECRGQVLECAEQCRRCGNPLWKYEWLTSTD